MRALILAGGKGTRLRPLTVYTPKPIVPIANRPFLLYQLEVLARAGITDITLSLGYQPNKIEELVGDGSDFGVNLSFVTEPSPLGTAGAYRHAVGRSRATTVVLNGDILTDADISAIVERHSSGGAEATLTLARVQDPSKYGLVETGSDGRVERFIEKPSEEEAKSVGVDTINAGIYVLEPSVLDLIEEGANSSFEYGVFPMLLESGRPIHSFVIDGGYWRDIGTPESYLEAHHDLLGGRIPHISIDQRVGPDVSPTAQIDDLSVIGPECTIKPNAVITNSVLGPGVHVEERAVINGSVIWAHTRVSTFAELNDSVIGRGSHIGRNVITRPGTVIGDKGVLPDYSKT
jgi:NDP-sugar pyrophosphorylase family protein